MSTKSAFEIGIPFSQFEKAETAIKAAYGTEEEQHDAAGLLPYGDFRGVFPWRPSLKGFVRAAPGREQEPDSSAAAAPEEPDAGEQAENIPTDWNPTKWNPEDATVQVWVDKQSYAGDMIQMALRENQIHARFDKAEGRNAMFVLQQDEIRAREIVREVMESAPPG
jgi:hypothetical protein